MISTVLIALAAVGTFMSQILGIDVPLLIVRGMFMFYAIVSSWVLRQSGAGKAWRIGAGFVFAFCIFSIFRV